MELVCNALVYHSTTAPHSGMLWCSFSFLCRVLWACAPTNIKSWKKTSDLNATTRLQAQLRRLVNCVMHALKLWASRRRFKDSFRRWSHAGLRDRILYFFFRLHTLSKIKCFEHSFGLPICCAAENRFAAIQFYSLKQSLESPEPDEQTVSSGHWVGLNRPTFFQAIISRKD